MINHPKQHLTTRELVKYIDTKKDATPDEILLARRLEEALRNKSSDAGEASYV